jgi:hypothetical protein
MIKAPNWFAALAWSDPKRIEDLRDDRTVIPKNSGVYVFTNYPERLEKNTGVLYVGKAKSLHGRMQSYLADPSEMLVLSKRSGSHRVSSSLRHAGKVQILMEVQQRMRALGHTKSGIWVRWHIAASPAVIEDQLIKYLQPAFNTIGRGEDPSDI